MKDIRRRVECNVVCSLCAQLLRTAMATQHDTGTRVEPRDGSPSRRRDDSALAQNLSSLVHASRVQEMPQAELGQMAQDLQAEAAKVVPKLIEVVPEL